MTARTAFGLDVMPVRSPLGVTTETFLIDICLKICKKLINLQLCNY